MHLWEVHVVLAAVGSDDARNLVWQARAEVVDLGIINVEGVVVSREQFEGAPSPTRAFT